MPVDWIRDLASRLCDRATWYDAPEDFIAGIEAFAASVEARLRGHPSSSATDSTAEPEKSSGDGDDNVVSL